MAKHLVMLARMFMALLKTYFFKMLAFCWLQNLFPRPSGIAEWSGCSGNLPRLNEKRVTGFEPATFSLGSFSSNQQEPLHSNESQELAGLDVRRSVRSLGSWPLLCDLLQE